jgi:hypothetical protein
VLHKQLLSASILLAISSGIQAKIYTDQLVLDSLGEDVCRSGYRPIDHLEAQVHRDYLVSQMSEWQVAGLKDNWVITGSGYSGEIKQDSPNDSTWCHPASDQSAIPEFPPKSIPEGEEIDVQYALVHDHENFVRPLSNLAHNLGYAWVSGNSGQYVGEDMNIQHPGDKWIIQGNNNGSCSGYRCDEKTQITIGNFIYSLNDRDFWHGDVFESDRELVKTISAVARNNTDVPQLVVIHLTVEETTLWRKTNTHSFATSVQVENTFKWPAVGETKMGLTFEAKDSFAETNGGTSTEETMLEARTTIPENSEIPIRVELYRSSISYPYRFGAKISYDVNFNGFLRWGGNAWHTHPDDRPNHSHTFIIGRNSEPSSDIRYQWDHRYIPDEVKWWDWGWAIKEHGLSRMQDVAGKSLRPFNSYVAGQFEATSQYAGSLEIGDPVELGTTSNHTLQASPQETNETPSEPIEVITDFDADELDSLGFSNATFSVRVVE